MKTLFFAYGFFLVSTALSVAQSRVSVAPTYWFNYGNYSYETHSLYDGSNASLSGYSVASSFGLTARYQFKPKWDLSVGLLYNRNLSYVKAPNLGEIRTSTTSIQLPVLINYRLSEHRLSPYFSAGALLGKSATNTHESVKAHALIGAGLDCKLNSRLSWLLQPTASYLLSKPINNILFEYNYFRSHSLGLQAQLIWHL